MSQVTRGPEILLARGDAGLWSLAGGGGGDWREETRKAKGGFSPTLLSR